MRPFRRILCPVDFSEFSVPTVALARRMADDFGAVVQVLYVADTREFSPAIAVHDPAAAAANRARVESHLARFLREMSLDPEQGVIVDGIVHRSIVQQARDGEFDLVMMGTHGHSGFERLLLGSVTEKVLHKLEVPLLAVPAQAGLSASDLAGAPAFRSIMVGTDLGPETGASVDFGLALARRYAARLVLVHVVTPQAGVLLPPEAAMVVATAETPILMRHQAAKDALAELVETRRRADEEIDTLVTDGLPAATLTRVAREKEADLLIVGAHGVGRTELGWVGSTCHRVLRTSPCPVLAVRVPAPQAPARVA
ncbi:MAG: universal stress protein [Acidobacteriota bacterium]